MCVFFFIPLLLLPSILYKFVSLYSVFLLFFFSIANIRCFPVSSGEYACVCKLNITIKTDRCDLCQSESCSYFYSQSQWIWIYCMRFSSLCKHSLDKHIHQEQKIKRFFLLLCLHRTCIIFTFCRIFTSNGRYETWIQI